jgi:dGTPase
MMDWHQLLNSKRLGNRVSKLELGRSPFNSDHDKVIFSGAFRRLAKKTQVHPLATNDHVHNRLTHSLEVACVGRSLGIRVGQHLAAKLPQGTVPADIGDIVQTACLAHDIGNPPFGHTGEEAIRYWFKNDGTAFTQGLLPSERCDLENFEGNAQGFRVLTTAEYHPYDGGMRLTYASLASFIKYPWTAAPTVAGLRPKENKYGIFNAELPLFAEVAAQTGLIQRPGDDWYCRHPLVNLMEVADDFCYGLLDLEDGLEMEILEWDEIFELLSPVLPQAGLDDLRRELMGLSVGRRPSLIRGKVISAYVEAAAHAFIHNESKFLSGEVGELLPLCDPCVRTSVQEAKDLAKRKVFSHPRKIELEIGAYSSISNVLAVLCEAAFEYINTPQKMSFRSKRALDLIGVGTFHPQMYTSKNHTPMYLALMRVIDFVSGMTDHYATYLARQFNGMGE